MTPERTSGQIANLYDPQWTELDIRDSKGRDFLGIETLSDAILIDMLPGINNQTRRARYYSFWAWVLYRFIEDRSAQHTQAGFYEWLRKRENILVLGFLSHGCYEEGSRLAGTQKGAQIWQGGQNTIYPLDWKTFQSVNGGSYQLYYRGALQEMNIILREPGKSFDSLTENPGLPLAKAYAQSAERTNYVHDHFNATQLRKSDIEQFSEYGCLCHLGKAPFTDERLLLRDAFFRFDTSDFFAIRRLQSLSLLLDVIAQSQEKPLWEDNFRTVMYFWAFDRQFSYSPEGNLVEPTWRWRIFQLRQYFVFAVESIWAAFLFRLSEGDLTPGEYLVWLYSKLNLGELKRQYGLALSTTRLNQLTVSALFEAIRDAAGPSAFKSGSAALKTKLNEQAIKELIAAQRDGADTRQLVGGGILMLALIYWRCQDWRDQEAWKYVSDSYAGGRMPMDSFLRHIQHAMDEGWTVAKWLETFHHQYLWSQHRRVVMEKYLARGQETSRFEIIDISDSVEEKQRLHWLGTDLPKMNGPRFPSALNIMLDLDLIGWAGQEGRRLTNEGKAVLKRFKNYTIPAYVEPSAENDEGADDEIA
jgi:hypothetical protein